MVSIGDKFSSIEEARKAIRQYTIDDSELYAFHKSDQRLNDTAKERPNRARGSVEGVES